MTQGGKEGGLAALTFSLILFLSGASLPGKAQPGNEMPSYLLAGYAQEKFYLGGETCLACHDIRAAFSQNPHFKNWEKESLPQSKQGCEGCHGPGSEHIKVGVNPGEIFNFKKVTAQQISTTCLACHQQDKERVNFKRNEHGLNTVACTECHTIHTAQVKESLLAARPPALCYDCHEEVRSEFNKPFRHKVQEGWMGCSDCHNPHGGFNLRQTRNSTGTDIVCYECHADKQGPFVFEHVPVKVESCSICHDVHGSTNPRMLKRSEMRFLCLGCHAGTPGVLGPTTPTFHNITQARWQHCTDCHVNIHGSNINKFFFE